MIEINYGHRPRDYPNVGYGRVSFESDEIHLIAHETWNRVAFCGQILLDEPINTFDYGTVCETCARLLGVRSISDFEDCHENA